ncbi:acetyltransferase [Pedobacter sp. B4-66]|uniref:acetyltransferase n=1 Tax=Pedobacter sp. B4-66 TaxID=2817280 RepID=UPI001BDB13A8|nr:acetyltransferase [Pedobacter sp. B4-66]
MHIIGASGHAKVIIDILKLNKQDITGVWDDNEEIKCLSSFKINGTILEFKKLTSPEAIISIGNNRIREMLAKQLNLEFGIAIHPSSVIADSVEILAGTVVMANVSINADAYIGRHAILNTNASIDHDCKIGDFVHISPQVGLAGNVIVGEGTHIGIGANVIQGIKIGQWATIGAGAVIIKDVPDFAVVVGNPARIIKYNTIM